MAGVNNLHDEQRPGVEFSLAKAATANAQIPKKLAKLPLEAY